MLQVQIARAVKNTFEDTLQTSYFHWNNVLKYAMLSVVDQVLGEVVWSRSAHKVSLAEMHSHNQTKNLVDTIIKPALSNTGLIIPMPETVG